MRVQLWECKKELKSEDGTSKEVDISFIYKNALILGEAKSNKLSLSYIIGDTKSLSFRRRKIMTAITEVNEKADWLINHLNGTNYQLPKEIDLRIPIVITPI